MRFSKIIYVRGQVKTMKLTMNSFMVFLPFKHQTSQRNFSLGFILIDRLEKCSLYFNIFINTLHS
jgi:hypothetical protein